MIFGQGQGFMIWVHFSKNQGRNFLWFWGDFKILLEVELFKDKYQGAFYFQGGNFSDKVSTFLWLGWTFSFFSHPFLPKNQDPFKNLKKTLFRSRFFDRGNNLSKIIHNFLIAAFSFLLYFSTNVFYFQKLADSLLTFKKAQDRGKTFYFFAKVTFSNQTPLKTPHTHSKNQEKILKNKKEYSHPQTHSTST